MSGSFWQGALSLPAHSGSALLMCSLCVLDVSLVERGCARVVAEMQYRLPAPKLGGAARPEAINHIISLLLTRHQPCRLHMQQGCGGGQGETSEFDSFVRSIVDKGSKKEAKKGGSCAERTAPPCLLSTFIST